jgi:vacuolar-type H+-ATPase subunit I/STV1
VEKAKEGVANAAKSAGEAKTEADQIRGELVQMQASIRDETADAIDAAIAAKEYATVKEVGEAIADVDKQVNEEAAERKKAVSALEGKVNETLETKFAAMEAKLKELSATPATSAAQDSAVTSAASIAERAAVSAAEAREAVQAAKSDVAALTQKFEKLREDHEALIATEKEIVSDKATNILIPVNRKPSLQDVETVLVIQVLVGTDRIGRKRSTRRNPVQTTVPVRSHPAVQVVDDDFIRLFEVCPFALGDLKHITPAMARAVESVVSAEVLVAD